MIDIFDKDGNLIKLDDRIPIYGTNLRQKSNETVFSKVELKALFNQLELEGNETQNQNYLTQIANRLRRKLEKLFASYHLFFLISHNQIICEIDKMNAQELLKKPPKRLLDFWKQFESYPEPIRETIGESVKNLRDFMSDIEKKRQEIDLAIKKRIKKQTETTQKETQK